jgi:hypothetical protein
MNTRDGKLEVHTALHDICSTLSAMENAMNGLASNPNSKEDYRQLFQRGRERIIKHFNYLLKNSEDRPNEDNK